MSLHFKPTYYLWRRVATVPGLRLLRGITMVVNLSHFPTASWMAI